jgi:YHS domain-containing protein
MVTSVSVFRRLVVLTSLFFLGAAAHAGSTVHGASKGPAIDGFDAVAYFTGGAPVEGDARFSHEWNGATWRFVSAGNLDRFKADPERYAPQYGGYCAYAMAHDSFASGDPKRWRIVDGKLYLNANLFAQSLWANNIPKRVVEADAHWPSKKRELEAKP